MRILHVDTGPALAGGQWQAARLIEKLSHFGDEQTLIAPRDAALFDWAARNGVARVELSFFSLRDAARDADIVHCHDARAHTKAVFLRHPAIVVSRRVGWPPRRGPLSWLKYTSAYQYIAVSEYVRRTLIDHGIGERLIDVVYDAVPLPTKMSDRTGEALTLDKRRGRPWPAPTESEWLHARAFVYVTEMEGLGSAALLAMAYGVPVIASNAGGLPEIVRHEETGLLIADSPDDALARFENDPALVRRCVDNGRALVARRHTVEQMATLTRQIYEKVMTRRR